MQVPSSERVSHAVRAPSVRLRALLALALLVGFYIFTLAVAAVLFALPPLLVFGTEQFRVGIQILFIFALGWIPAGSLVHGAFTVRRPKFATKGKLLARSDAPELFAALDEIGKAARTAPPSEVYLEALPEMGVLETGGFLGFGSKRVLLLGAPYLEVVSVQEMRAILAHELGHFAGGDTRLGGLLGYTQAAFQSIIRSSRRDAFRKGTSHAAIEVGLDAAQAIGAGVVRAYARFFFFITMPGSRRQELAADALAATIAGRDAAIRALEGTSALVPYYRLYLENEVGNAIRTGAMPTDLLAGFHHFRTRFAESEPAQALGKAILEEKTNRYDSHPALTDRVGSARFRLERTTTTYAPRARWSIARCSRIGSLTRRCTPSSRRVCSRS
jgi:Zn-dependent protease with chaperone function